jgi:murein DD-endopeptidase MepM/ murein hydrolase activator NlpD
MSRHRFERGDRADVERSPSSLFSIDLLQNTGRDRTRDLDLPDLWIDTQSSANGRHRNSELSSKQILDLVDKLDDGAKVLMQEILESWGDAGHGHLPRWARRLLNRLRRETTDSAASHRNSGDTAPAGSSVYDYSAVGPNSSGGEYQGGGTYGGSASTARTSGGDAGLTPSGSAPSAGGDIPSSSRDYGVAPSDLEVIEANGKAFPVSGYEGSVDLHWGQNAGAADIFAERGTPVVAMQSGTVMWARNDSIGGYNVGIRQDDGLVAYYAHMDQPPLVQEGQRVDTGQQIGTVGDSGNAKGTGPHLHFAVGTEIISGVGPAGGTGAGVDNYALLNEILTSA